MTWLEWLPVFAFSASLGIAYFTTFCAGCGGYYPWREFRWDDDGENVGAYMDRLRAEWLEQNPRH